MTFVSRFSVPVLCVIMLSHLSCLTLKQKKRKVTETTANFTIAYGMRSPNNVSVWNYPPLFQDSVLRKMSNREFKRELNGLKTATSLFLDTLDPSSDSIFHYK